VIDRLLVKFDTARTLVPEPEIRYSKANKIAIVSVGSCDGAVKESLEELKKDDIGVNYCRIKAFPFNDAVREFLDNHEQVYVVEQNRDAQLRSLLILDLEIDPARLVPVLHYDGMPLHARFVTERILAEVARSCAA
jgi:2-oxoglutarate ferredoxin oxidoreductase subunit alpha